MSPLKESQSSLLFSSVLSLVGLAVTAAESEASDEVFLRRGPGGGGREGFAVPAVEVLASGIGAVVTAGVVEVVEVLAAVWRRDT